MFREQVKLDDCALIWENGSVIGDELRNEKKVLATMFLVTCFASTGNYVGWSVCFLCLFQVGEHSDQGKAC